MLLPHSHTPSTPLVASASLLISKLCPCRIAALNLGRCAHARVRLSQHLSEPKALIAAISANTSEKEQSGDAVSFFKYYKNIITFFLQPPRSRMSIKVPVTSAFRYLMKGKKPTPEVTAFKRVLHLSRRPAYLR